MYYYYEQTLTLGILSAHQSCTGVIACCTEKGTCGKDQYKCLKVYQCIPLAKKYDGHKDCYDGSDETGQGECFDYAVSP